MTKSSESPTFVMDGGTIDTRANKLYAAQPLTAWTNQTAVAYDESDYNTMPALVKKGSGVLRLTGANTYLCATAVGEGCTLAKPTGRLVIDATGTACGRQIRLSTKVGRFR